VLGISKGVLTVAVAICVAGSAFAQDQSGFGRPPRITTLAAPPDRDIGLIAPSFIFNNASVATGAVGLRNRGDGGINISGVGAPIKQAFAYWAVVTNGPPTAAAANISLKKGAAGGSFTNIQGVPIGAGASPCWKGDRTTVYRGIVPNSLANGNGLYLVVLRAGANGAVGGQSPWEVRNLPLFEGVSIVLVGSGASKVAVYDEDLAGEMFYGRLAYQLKSPFSVAAATTVLLNEIGADGQSGVGVSEVASVSAEVTRLNGRVIAGPGSPGGAGDWNGIVAGPLPQLWDNNTHNVTNAAKAGNPLVLSFVINAPDDCLVTVANVLSVE